MKKCERKTEEGRRLNGEDINDMTPHKDDGIRTAFEKELTRLMELSLG